MAGTHSWALSAPRTSIAGDVRELAISRVAAVNRAWYEWGHHAPLAVQAGVSESSMEILKREDALSLADKDAAKFNEQQWATVVYADEMTRNVEVKDETVARLKELFSEKEMIEITATVRHPPRLSRFPLTLCTRETLHSNAHHPSLGYATTV